MPPELSEKTETQKSLFAFLFSYHIRSSFDISFIKPSFISSIGLAKIVCLQCSDHVCAKRLQLNISRISSKFIKIFLNYFHGARSKASGPRLSPSSPKILPSDFYQFFIRHPKGNSNDRSVFFQNYFRRLERQSAYLFNFFSIRNIRAFNQRVV